MLSLIGIAYPLFNAYLMPTSHFIFRHKVQHPVRQAWVRHTTTIQLYPSLASPGLSLPVHYTHADYIHIGMRCRWLKELSIMHWFFSFRCTESCMCMWVVCWRSCPRSQNLTPNIADPAPHRGTGNALCSGLNRISRFIAPLIKIATTPLDGSTSANMENGCVVITSIFASYWSESVNMVISICIWCLILQTAGKMALWVSCTQHKPISGVDPPWRFEPHV